MKTSTDDAYSFPNAEDCLAGIFSHENLVSADTYPVEFCGTCLGGVVASGARLTVDPSLTLRPSDVVAVVLRDDAGPYANFVNTIGSGGFAGVCKIYLGCKNVGGEPVHLLAQLDPPLVSPVPATAIQAMHRVAAISDDEAGGLSGQDSAAIDLLMMFVQVGEWPPLNSDWVPGKAAQ